MTAASSTRPAPAPTSTSNAPGTGSYRRTTGRSPTRNDPTSRPPQPQRPHGLWQLAGLERDSARAHGYADYAVRILTRLCEDDFLAHDDPAWEGVLKHGSYHEAKGLGVDESVMWGDYWFLDAIAVVDAAARPAN